MSGKIFLNLSARKLYLQPPKIYNDESALIENQMDRLSHVSQYVYPSELKEFAVKRLGIRETKYEMIEDHIYAKWRNFEINVKVTKLSVRIFFQLTFFLITF